MRGFFSQEGEAGITRISSPGPCQWDIAGLIKTNAFPCDARANDICGKVLRIEEGKLRLEAGTIQTVRKLCLESIQ